MQTRILEYAQRDSLLHRMDPRWKLAAVVLAIALVVALRTVEGAAAALLGAILLLGMSRLPVRWYLGRLAGVGLFLAACLIILPLSMPGNEIDLGLLKLSQRGLWVALLIGTKALTVVALVLLLFATSPLETLFKAAAALRIPNLLIQLLMLTYRYIFLFLEELNKLRIALRLRAYRNRMSAHSYRTIGHVAGTLLVRSYERAERVGHAMRCRGFDGTFRSFGTFAATVGDVGKALLIVCLVAGVAWFLDLPAWQWYSL